MNDGYPPPGVRRAITASLMAATLMNSLDTTIANVALPHIQGSVAASADEITWVLTSYIVAAAICTPLTGWLAGRFGRRQLMMWSVVGFTVASGICGLATNLDELILFRLLQGVFGSALMPISQATLLDINPPARHNSAMAIWSMAAILGPILGPSTGGWLTENLSWRWVFFINLPVGIVAFLGISAFLPDARVQGHRRFDLLGFAMLALAVGALQLTLDRGQTQDWFSSTEICVEATCAAFFGYLFIVHMLTARQPFIDLSLFTDRNFVVASGFGFFLNMVLFGVLALLPPMLEGLMGYPVVLTGLVTAPRGIGTLISMMLVSPLLKRLDARMVIFVGFALSAWSIYRLCGVSLDMDPSLVTSSGFIQGLGTGFIFVALTSMAFGTLPGPLRNEGAAMFSLIRSLGSASGISILQALMVRQTAVVHSRLGEGIRPDNPVLAGGFDFNLPTAVARMNAQITRQATMVAYTDVFWLLFVGSLVLMPAILLLRPPRRKAGGEDLQLHME